MPHFFDDKAICSSNSIIFMKSTELMSNYADNSISKARIEEVLYTDDPKNSTYNTNNPQVEYTCLVLGGLSAGERLHHVVAMTDSGGPFNSSEKIYGANSNEDMSGSTPKAADVTSGEIVLLAKLHGYPQAGVIVGCLKHPKSGKGATKTDGARKTWSYNGVTWTINKDGELVISFGGGPKDAQGNSPNSSAAGSNITFSKNGGIQMVDKDGNGINIDAANKKLILQGGSGGIQTTAGGDWNIQVSGSANIQASSQINLDSSMINLLSGGMQAARMNDQVLGTDSQGGPINAYIGMGSSAVLIGG